MTTKWAAIGAAALALAACGDQPAGTGPKSEPTAAITPAPGGDEPVSIIRPEADVERQLAPLEPLEARISFDEGGAKLSETAAAELKAVLETRQYQAGGAIILRGHTDSAGDDRANLRASQRRAEAVRDWMVENGVDQKRITVIALGEQNPARPNARPDGTPDEKGRAFNRRVTVTIAVPAELSGAAQAEQPTLVEQVSDN